MPSSRLADRWLYPRSRAMASRQRPLDEPGRRRIERALRERFYAPSARAWLESEEGRRHLHGHVVGRLAHDRRRVVPWLDAARPLEGARVLEIGCGTGSSTVALAEQGAEVVALDLSSEHIAIAEERCAVHGVKARFVAANATRAAELLTGECFDFAIFFAALEHMTHEERMIAMGNTWGMLAPGALWVVVETPNRLHFFDDHSSLLPFFHWLPDEVAFDYGTRSPRAAFASFLAGKPRTSETLRGLQRFGRAISYHEFELAMAPLAELEVVSSLRTFSRGLRALRRVQRTLTPTGRHQALLSKLRPDVHPAFFEPWLNLILRRR
jgi:S-adenosylmethionine-dependent methyltransferase